MNKPTAYESQSFPFNSLDDRAFEELVYQIFRKKIDTNTDFYDEVHLMPGVGEQGQDIKLTLKGKSVGIIQCKKNQKNLDRNTIIREIIKFCLHYIINDRDLISDADNFRYIIAVSHGLTKQSLKLISNFNEEIFKDDLENLSNSVINEYVSFNGTSYSSIQDELTFILKKIKVNKIIPSDMNLFLSHEHGIAEYFFKIRTVIAEVTDIEKNAIELLDKYKSSAIRKLDNVNFFGLALQANLTKPLGASLRKLFVSPQFIKKGTDRETPKMLQVNYARFLNFKELFSKTVGNLVILGDPGIGKSSLVKFSALSIFLSERDFVGDILVNYVPIIVELRKYASHKSTNVGTGLVEYITASFASFYQIDGVKQDFVSYLLDHKNVILFFDGLDEIFDLQQKNEIKEDIESFSDVHSKIICVITSRKIGYHDISAFNQKFQEYSIAPFNDIQIFDFIGKFYKELKHSSTIDPMEVDLCFQQIKEIGDNLKRNPLLLSLILILIQNNRIIPDSKLELYESCTKTLVETRDEKEKDLKLPISSKLKHQVFGHLAFWQYKRLSSGSQEVTYLQIFKVVKDYFLKKKDQFDLDDAEIMTQNFLDYAERRSIYFENNFTHKTFLEYYASNYIFSNFQMRHDFQQRDEIIDSYFCSPFWFIVFELFFAKLDNEVEDTSIIDEILSKRLHSKKEEKKIHNFLFLCYLVGSLVNVGKTLKKNAVHGAVMAIISSDTIEGNLFDADDGLLYSFSNRLFSKLRNVLIEVVNELALSLGEHEKVKLYSFLSEFNFKIEGVFSFFPTLTADIKSLCLKNEYIFFLHNFVEEKTSDLLKENIFKMVELYGPSSISKTFPLTFLKKIFYPPVFVIYLNKCKKILTQPLNAKKLFNDLNSKGFTFDHQIESIKTRLYLFFDEEEKEEEEFFFSIFDVYINLRKKEYILVYEAIILSLLKHRRYGSEDMYSKILKKYPNKQQKIDSLLSKARRNSSIAMQKRLAKSSL